MKKFLIIFAALLTFGCNQIMGGPSSDEIKRVAKESMVASSASPELAALAKDAEISPKGVCNPSDNQYACAVDVKVKGQSEPKTFVVVLKKDASGKWIDAQ